MSFATTETKTVITRTLSIPESEVNGTPFIVNSCYTSEGGDSLLQMITILDASDTMGDVYRRFSSDNGMAWSGVEKSFSPETVEGGGKLRRGECGLLYDAERDVILNFFNMSIYPAGDSFDGHVRLFTKIFYSMSRDGGKTFSEPLQLIQDGFDDTNWMDGVTYRENGAAISFVHPLVDSRGRIILPMQRAPKNISSVENPYLIPYSSGCMIGTWNGSGYNWKAGNFADISPEKSTRGLCEPTIAEMPDGRFVMIMRGSNLSRENELQGHKWMSVSIDGCMSWSEPQPLCLSSGEPIWSAATGSYLFKNSHNGKFYWIGNISPENPSGNWPRSPLHICEFDPDSLTLVKESVTEIDRRQDEDSKWVQLSNFRAYPDRFRNVVHVYLGRLGEHGGGEQKMKSDGYHYQIEIA